MDKTLKQNVTYKNCYPETGEKCSAAHKTCSWAYGIIKHLGGFWLVDFGVGSPMFFKLAGTKSFFTYLARQKHLLFLVIFSISLLFWFRAGLGVIDSNSAAIWLTWPRMHCVMRR